MRGVIAAVVAAVLLSVAPPSYADDRAPDAGSRATPHGRWVLDPNGRALLMHGINMVYKLDPYAPDAIGFGRDDAQFLARNGFTTVRLGLIWKAVEPSPGRYDDRYLARIRRTTELLAAEGIWTMLDFHQDLWHEDFQGEGAPDWAVLDDGLPSQPQLGFPYSYFANLGLNRSFDNFWANVTVPAPRLRGAGPDGEVEGVGAHRRASDGVRDSSRNTGPGGVGLQDRFAAAWAHVASYFRSTPRVLGLDIFNEPWPGTGWQACANTVGCPLFDARLEAFSQRVIDAVRRVDRRTPVFYEPHVLFNNGVPTFVRPRGTRLGFSFHDYCLTADIGVGESSGADPVCGTFNGLVWDNVAGHVAATGHPAVLSEFGATDALPTILDMLDRAERDLVGWQYWAYCGCSDPTTTGPGTTQALVYDPKLPPTGRNVAQSKLRALVTPHPLAVAGTPTALRFDRATRRMRATWSTARPSGRGRFGVGSRSAVSTPRLVYPRGYRVWVRGARVVSRPGAARLVLEQRRGARQVVVVVRPR